MKARIIRWVTAVAVILCLLPVTLPAQSLSIWPGDVDNNGVVNNLDLLYLGRAIGVHGPVRDSVNNVWSEQHVTQWVDHLPDAAQTDMAYADCNGDGVISASDEMAIIQNYGLARSGATADTNYSTGDSSSPALYFATLEDNFPGGSQVTLYVTLGTPAIQVDSFFGIAFSIQYDSNIIQKNTVTAAFNSRWIDSQDKSLFIQHNVTEASRLDIAITLKNISGGIPVGALTGYGNVATVSYILENNVIGKTESIVAMPVVASKVRMLDRNMSTLAVQALADTLHVITTSTGLNNISSVPNVNILVYPNPAHNELNIETGNKIAHEVALYNIVGAQVMRLTPEKPGLTTLNINNLTAGIYIVRVTTDTGVATRKVFIE